MYQRKTPPVSPNTTVMSTLEEQSKMMAPLVVSSSSSTSPRSLRRRRKTQGTVEMLPWMVIVVALVMIVATVGALVYWKSSSSNNNTTATEHVGSALSDSYTCPAVTTQAETAENFDPIRFQNHYLQEDAHTRDLQDFLANFRHTTYDDWGQTYEHMKEGMTAWKQRAMVPFVKPGDKIYESAIGMGLNAFMTLEIMQQALGPIELEIHGNEYLATSTERANAFFNHVLPSHVRKGNVCVGDSTNIPYVPSNTFDMVFTGYILPIGNPLHFDQPNVDPFGINHGRYHELCDGDSWRDVTLRDIAQRRQEDFYAAWVSEMIRIAKPGSPVIVEHVSQPKCDDREDWGGVSKAWWTVAIERYNWPIDPDSIFMEDDHIYTFHRYHVFMRKTLE